MTFASHCDLDLWHRVMGLVRDTPTHHYKHFDQVIWKCYNNFWSYSPDKLGRTHAHTLKSCKLWRLCLAHRKRARQKLGDQVKLCKFFLLKLHWVDYLHLNHFLISHLWNVNISKSMWSNWLKIHMKYSELIMLYIKDILRSCILWKKQYGGFAGFSHLVTFRSRKSENMFKLSQMWSL